MKTMTAAQAKNAFGLLLDTMQREPVVITKKNRPVGMMLSMQDVEALARLADGQPTTMGEVSTVEEKVALIDTVLERRRIDDRVAQSRREIAEGKGIAMDEAYFERLRARIRDRAVSR
jgi:prevent-host-death family protein